jgi:hypothetical protein
MHPLSAGGDAITGAFAPLSWPKRATKWPTTPPSAAPSNRDGVNTPPGLPDDTEAVVATALAKKITTSTLSSSR